MSIIYQKSAFDSGKTEYFAENLIKDFVHTVEKIIDFFSKTKETISISNNNTTNKETFSKKNISIQTVFSQKISKACAWFTNKIRQIRDYIVENPKKSALIGTAVLVGGGTLYAGYAKYTQSSTTTIRSNPPFHVDVPQEAKNKLETLMPLIVKGKNHPDIKWIVKGNNYVFSLKSNPEIVFKMMTKQNAVQWKNPPKAILEQRFENMEIGRKVCIEEGLDLLKVPKVSLIKVEKPTLGKTKEQYLLAEEKLPLNPSPFEQAEQFINSPRLVRTAEQTAKFIARTGFKDLKPDNIPLLDGDLNKTRKVGLIDLEHFGNKQIGIFGQTYFQAIQKQNAKTPLPGKEKSGEIVSLGLIKCFHRPEEKQAILDVAKEHGIQEPPAAPIFSPFLAQLLFKLDAPPLKPKLDLLVNKGKVQG